MQKNVSQKDIYNIVFILFAFVHSISKGTDLCFISKINFAIFSVWNEISEMETQLRTYEFNLRWFALSPGPKLWLHFLISKIDHFSTTILCFWYLKASYYTWQKKFTSFPEETWDLMWPPLPGYVGIWQGTDDLHSSGSYVHLWGCVHSTKCSWASDSHSKCFQ